MGAIKIKIPSISVEGHLASTSDIPTSVDFSISNTGTDINVWLSIDEFLDILEEDILGGATSVSPEQQKRFLNIAERLLTTKAAIWEMDNTCDKCELPEEHCSDCSVLAEIKQRALRDV